MAASLGIHASNIKVVAVYQGSVIVQYEIVDRIGDIIQKFGGLEALSQELINQISTKSINLGAPILSADVSSTSVTIATDGEITVPVINPSTNTTNSSTSN